MRRKVVGFILTCCFLLVSVFPVYADQTTTETSADSANGLTINKAVEMAKSSSVTLKNLDLQIERNQQVRDKLADNLQFIPVAGEATASAESAFTSVASKDISLQSSKYDKTIAEDQLEYSVNSAYTGVLNAQRTLEYNKKNLENEQFLVKVSRVSAGLGLVSPYASNAQELSYKSAQDSVATAEIDLKKAYEALNKLIGLNADERPVLVDKPSFEKLVIGDLDGEISRIIDSNPKIWQADENVAQAILTYDYYDGNGTTAAPSSAVKIDLDKAKLSAGDARTTAKQALRTLYNTISNYETTYPVALQALTVAQDNLRIVKVKYEIGMATQGDVISAELAVEAKAKAIDTLVYAHELAKMAFEKPWSAS